MKNYKISIIFYNTSTHFIVLYPNRTRHHLKIPYKAHKYRFCRDLPIYSNSFSGLIFHITLLLLRFLSYLSSGTLTFLYFHHLL